jgi:putative transposase
MKAIGIVERQECGRWLNNRAENSHQPFRRRERAMAKFRDMKILQKFTSVHTSIHNHFNQDRHLNRHDSSKQNRSATLAEWRHLAAGDPSLRAFWRPVRIGLTAPWRTLAAPRKPT